MSELIQLVQKQDPGSELVELFEVEIDGSTIYIHPGLNDNLTSIQFRDRTTPATIREYAAFPIEMGGVDFSSDGAQNRPTLTIANVFNLFAEIGDFYAEDLIGKRVTKRQTLKKYLYGEVGDANPPVEFPIKKYIIDRISSENNISITFELSAPFDLSGIELPNRTVVGKYCSWVYQGHQTSSIGGCIWSKNSVVQYANGSNGVNSHKAYFDIEDSFISAYTTYSAGSSYVQDDYVEYTSDGQTTLWKATRNTTGNTPSSNSVYWVRGDVCGKKLSSCKCRFQFKPTNPAVSNSTPATEKDSNKVLPFGAFPGSMKFR